MDRVVPWGALVALIALVYPNGEGAGRPPVKVERMLRNHCRQYRVNLPDLVVEEAVYDSRAMCELAGIDRGRDARLFPAGALRCPLVRRPAAGVRRGRDGADSLGMWVRDRPTTSGAGPALRIACSGRTGAGPAHGRRTTLRRTKALNAACSRAPSRGVVPLHNQQKRQDWDMREQEYVTTFRSAPSAHRAATIARRSGQ